MSVKRSSAERGSSVGRRPTENLGERRRQGRRRIRIAFCILLLLLLTAAIYELHQPYLRISRVQIFGADQSLSTIALTAMQGSYLGLIPRDSSFFYPETRIRTDILAANPDIAAISIFRNGFDGLTIRVDNRTPIAQWCGAPPATIRFNVGTSSPRLDTVTDCYVFDANGVIYATTSATKLVNSFVVYESLTSGSGPLDSVLPNASELPSVFDFTRKLSAFGPMVVSIVIHDGEVDEYLVNGTRITYVLGHEQDAFNALTSAHANLNLTSGSIEYVDLRFDGKVYLKKKQ